MDRIPVVKASRDAAPVASALARQFATSLCRLDGESEPAVFWAARLVCQAVAEGQVCLRLENMAGTQVTDGDATVRLPPLRDWLARLRRSRLVGEAGAFAPLILDTHHRLYLARYWHYEKQLADRLLALAARTCDNIDLPRLRADLDQLFAHNRFQPDAQKLAAAVAVLRRFCIISGGPGTGKTSTVVRILAALQSQARERPLRIALSAPTGKAAARLKEAIRRQKETLGVPAGILASIPDDTSTLHRLLGARPDSVYFRHNRENPLPVEVLVVDEASMIDLALMAKLVDALPEHARLILLGDKDQLASVEAGAVFGDLCGTSGYSPDLCELLHRASGIHPQRGDLFVPPLSDCVALLTHSHRFEEGSGIGELARRVNRGTARAAADLLVSGRYSDLAFEPETTRRDLAERMDEGYREYFLAVDGGAEPGEILRRLDRFRVLTVHRSGEDGAQGVNRCFEERLFARRRLRPGTRWYAGRPVIVTRNDYDLRLFNGDIGIALGAGGDLRVYFEDADGRIRAFTPGRLPEHATVYAMTVHKSQGSEFDEVLLLLPDAPSPVLDRPLIYTAITRARHRAEIRGSRAVLETGVKCLPSRSSGLRERLGGGL